MKSLLNKRLPGILAAGLVMLAVGAVGVTPAASASDAKTSGLNAKQKKAKKRQIRKCNKRFKHNRKRRRACVKHVKRRYARLAKRSRGKTVKVLVQDNFYAPAQVNLKAGDSIKWDWKFATGSEGHNVSLFQGPSGVSPFDFESPITRGPYTFKRKFTKPGTYNFVCSLHTLMRMKVKVTR